MKLIILIMFFIVFSACSSDNLNELNETENNSFNIEDDLNKTSDDIDLQRFKTYCEENSGQWDGNEYKCYDVSKEVCDNIGGNFNGCTNPCNENSNPDIYCPAVCFPICDFSELLSK